MSGTTRRNKPGRSQRPRCVLPTGTSCRQDFQRNLVPADAGDGVSTYLALTFGTLLSSQGTDASFVPVSPGSPGASLRSCVSDSIRSFRLRFSPVRSGLSALSAFPTLPDPFPSAAPCWSGVGLPGFRLFGLSDFSRSAPCRFPFGLRFGRIDFPSEGVPFGGPTLTECCGSEFRHRSGRHAAHVSARCFPFGRSRKPTGAGCPDANPGTPLLLEDVRTTSYGRGRQTSTTTGRIIGRRR